jgi:hypothetical protein
MAHSTLRRPRSAQSLLLLSVALGACNGHSLSQPAPESVQQTNDKVPINPRRDLDLLFVIDNSLSMAEEQASLAANFPLMIKELENLPEGMPDVHIAVVSSDFGAGPPSTSCGTYLGDHGRFLVKDGCPVKKGARWLESLEHGQKTNFQGDLPSAFGCLTNLGTAGCGYEHQLQSMRIALSDVNPENDGFLRQEAALGIIIVTDEDDCSAPPDSDLFASERKGEAGSLRCASEGHECDGQAPPRHAFSTSLDSCRARDGGKLIRVQEFVDFVKGLKPRPDEQILVAGIVGWPMDGGANLYRYGEDTKEGEIDYLPACNVTGAGRAYAGLRLKQFIEAFGKNSSMHSICGANFRSAMTKIGEALTRIIKPACVNARPVDTDLTTPGLQPDCQVSYLIPVEGKAPREELLPACEGTGQKPCWSLIQDDACAGSGAPYRIKIEDGGNQAPVGTVLSLRCLTCPGQQAPGCR